MVVLAAGERWRAPAGAAKWGSLLLFLGQNSLNGIIFRAATTEAVGSARASTAAVLFFTEGLKLLLSLGLLVAEEGGSLRQAARAVLVDGIGQPRESFKLAVPCVLYGLQNALLQWSSGDLPAAIWQVTYQGKILVTAALSVVLLRKDIKRVQWLAIAVMGLGLALVQLSGAREATQQSMANAAEQSVARGLAMLLLACCLSGFAGVYLEIIFKHTVSATGQQRSVWLQNALLAAFSMLLLLLSAAAAALLRAASAGDGPEGGLTLRGFTARTWALVVNNALGGLFVALVIRHADSILRGFTSAIATVIGIILAVFSFGFAVGPAFGSGTILVAGSTLLYGGIFKLPGAWWNSEPQLCSAARAAQGRARDACNDVELATLVGNAEDPELAATDDATEDSCSTGLKQPARPAG